MIIQQATRIDRCSVILYGTIYFVTVRSKSIFNGRI